MITDFWTHNPCPKLCSSICWWAGLQCPQACSWTWHEAVWNLCWGIRHTQAPQALLLLHAAPEHVLPRAPEPAGTAGDPGSTNKVEMPIRRNCKQSGEGLLIKKLLTYVKSNQGLYTDKRQSFNLNLVSVHDKSFDNSVPKSHRSKTSIADELIVITTRCVR